MQRLGAYVVSLTVIAILDSMLLSLVRQESARTIIRVVCGITMTVTALSPLKKIEIPDVSSFTSEFINQGRLEAAAGETMAREEICRRINESLEAYILDKADVTEGKVYLQFMLGEEHQPVSACISGILTEDEKRRITELLTDDLGIAKEDQQWTGENIKTASVP